MSPAHAPIIPPMSANTRERLLAVLSDLRRLQTDLQYAASAGLPVQLDLANTITAIARLQRLHDAYFPTPQF